jgi:protein SCO1/2
VARRLQLALLAVAALSLAAIVLVFAVGGSSREALGPGQFAGAVRPRIPAQDFVLRDQDGRIARLSAYRGRVAVVTFLYTTCRDSCPVMAQQIRGALDDLGHPVPVLAVSVDPAGDTPLRARAFLTRQHLLGRMRFLLGTRAQLAPVWRSFGIQPQERGRDHSAYVVLIDSHGRQRVGFPAEHLTPEGLAHDIRRLAAGASRD